MAASLVRLNELSFLVHIFCKRFLALCEKYRLSFLISQCSSWVDVGMTSALFRFLLHTFAYQDYDPAVGGLWMFMRGTFWSMRS